MQRPTHLDDIGIPDIHYNPLQNYRNVTYNTRLTMMPRIEATQERSQRSYDYKKGMIMWETGGSGTIYLEEMTMETVGTGSATGTYAMQQYHKFSGKLVEPVGGRFLESVAICALNLGYPNTSDAVYLLEITFSGYNTDSDMPEVCKGWDGEELVFRWYVRLMTLKMKLDYKGSTYDFEMVPAGGVAQQSDHLHIEQGMSMEGTPATVQQFCDDLAKALNKREEEKVKSGQRCHPHVYKVIPHRDIAGLAMADFSFLGRMVQSWGWFRGSIQMPAGTTIQQFILSSMPNSKEILSYLHRIPEKKDYNTSETKPDTIHILPRNLSIICGAKAREQNGAIMFDNKIGTSAKEVVYFLTSKMDAKNVIGAREYEDAWSQANRDKRVNEYLKLGLLRKAYKWIYTGENTEVINCDIKLDNLWRLVRPLFVDDKGVPIAQGASNQQPAQRGQRANPPVRCNEARMINVTPSGQASYAEDVPYRAGQDLDINPKPNWYPHMPQTAIVNTAVQQDARQGALSPQNAQEYSVYRQINNSQGQGSADMLTINLEVVGDPYFLFQIPGAPGRPPYEEDVWEYVEKNLTEEQMAVTRRRTASHNWLPFIYFQATIPAADFTSEDLMNLRQADTITGIYSCRKVVNKFFKGKFTSTVECYRDQLSNPWGRRTTNSTFSPQPAGGGQAAATGPRTGGNRGTRGGA